MASPSRSVWEVPPPAKVAPLGHEWPVAQAAATKGRAGSSNDPLLAKVGAGKAVASEPYLRPPGSGMPPIMLAD